MCLQPEPDAEAVALSIQVRCHAGHRGEETPRSFRLGRREVGIAEVLDRWHGPDHRYFKVRSLEDDRYILRHDEALHRWELTLFERGGSIPK
jgi:hypothetical protein